MNGKVILAAFFMPDEIDGSELFELLWRVLFILEIPIVELYLEPIPLDEFILIVIQLDTFEPKQLRVPEVF